MAPSDAFPVPDNFADRCAREYGWEFSMANKAIQGYQDLMKLKKLHQDWEGKILSPSSIVDKVWHLHLLDNLHYNKACRDFCGGTIVIGHDPEGAMDVAARAERRKTTKIALITLLGKDGVDDEVWGSLNEEATIAEPSRKIRKLARCSPRSEAKNINTTTSWCKKEGLTAELKDVILSDLACMPECIYCLTKLPIATALRQAACAFFWMTIVLMEMKQSAHWSWMMGIPLIAWKSKRVARD